MSRANQKRYIKLHESCKCKYRSDASVVTINNVGMKVNTGVNVKNWLIKVIVIMDLLGLLVILNANVINHEMLGNI